MVTKLSLWNMFWAYLLLVIGLVIIVDCASLKKLLIQTSEQVQDIRTTQTTVSLETTFLIVHEQAQHILKLDSILELSSDTITQMEQHVQFLESAVESASMQLKDLTDDNTALTIELEGSNDQRNQMKEEIADKNKEIKSITDQLTQLKTVCETQEKELTELRELLLEEVQLEIEINGN